MRVVFRKTLVGHQMETILGQMIPLDKLILLGSSRLPRRITYRALGFLSNLLSIFVCLFFELVVGGVYLLGFFNYDPTWFSPCGMIVLGGNFEN